MASLTLRSVKGTPLTNAEVDGNFTALNSELATMLTAALAASTYLALSGGTLTGKLSLPASTTSAAPVNLGSGTAPSSPVSGDVWIGSSGLQYHQGTVTQTVALLGASQTFTGAITVSGNLTAQASVSLGSASGTSTQQFAHGATTSGSTKTVSIATGGLSGSTTNITIGSQYGTSITSYGAISHTGTLSAAGLIESTSGGFKFPDGTIQTTAGGSANSVTNAGASGDNKFARFDGTTGKVIQDSGAILNDDGSARFENRLTIGLGTQTYGVLSFESYNGSGKQFDIRPAAAQTTGLLTWYLPPNNGSSGQALTTDGAGNLSWSNTVSGPASATDSRIALFDGTTGKLLKNFTSGLAYLTPDGEAYVTAIGQIQGRYSFTLNNADTTGLVLNSGTAGNSVTFKPPGSGGNSTFILPAGYGTNGQALITNGSGVMSWGTVSGGGGGTNTAIDGGLPDSSYAAITAIDGGTP